MVMVPIITMIPQLPTYYYLVTTHPLPSTCSSTPCTIRTKKKEDLTLLTLRRFRHFFRYQIAARDIGATLANEALAAGSTLPSVPYIFELHGPRDYSSIDVQKTFEEVTGKSIELRAVEPAGLRDFYAAAFPPSIAERFTDMTKSFHEGGILYEDPQPTGEKKYGKTELVEVIKQLLGKA